MSTDHNARDPRYVWEWKDGKLHWDLSPKMRLYQDIEAHNHDPIVDQGVFAFGDPGTETGHTLDTNSIDRVVALDGTGNYTFFLRIELDQTRTTQDQNLTMTFKLQFDIDGAASWADVDASTTAVQVIADSNIVDGAATTDRISASIATFLAGDYDEGDGTLDALTWNTGSAEHTESLWSLVAIDASLSAGQTVDFRVVEADNTVLNNDATSDKPRLTWNAPAVPGGSALTLLGVS